MGTRPVLPALALGLALAAVGCGGAGGDEDGTTLTVYAAASLTDTFEQVADRFEAEHDGVEVELALGGSSELAAQLVEGAPADVFASADTPTMDRVVDAGLTAGDPQPFASNTLQVAVPPGNPAGIGSLDDLGADGVRVVVCAPEVPCGAAARRVAEAAGVSLSPVSEEQKVTDVLAKVTTGEADAGLVYVTDVVAAGDAVDGIEVPEAAEVVNVYPVATLADSDDPDLARAFVDLLLGPTGQRVLADAGFAPAPVP
ncbi:molybdate ABC transporter substrate-binding protein [Nocardioides sp. SYSU D00038]|uniref:molybdate ABC transporter substrate-binding protein n=1 Tax=Nocardioides sp. SYSU D00038 TaxID=2812554 RepID=UPI0019678CE0|nr:molybdate ABC transporter substrate-binding protein [Nocardioides sp. SYSU D00038]